MTLLFPTIARIADRFAIRVAWIGVGAVVSMVLVPVTMVLDGRMADATGLSPYGPSPQAVSSASPFPSLSQGERP